MRRVGGLYVGWLETNICDLAIAGFLSRFESILIASIDSTRDLTRLASRFAEIDSGCALLGDGIIVRGGAICQPDQAQYWFNGFDEVWCFDGQPTIPLPRDVHLVAPRNVETDELPAGLATWFAESGCRIGFGDGVGLNFVTPDADIARQL